MSVCDVILGSGADTNALPLKCGHVGVDEQQLTHAMLMHKERLQQCNLQGWPTCSLVTCPLMSLGNVLRAGWNIIIDG